VTFVGEIDAGESRFFKPSTFWSASTAFFGHNYGSLATQGNFDLHLTANGYRNSSGTWTSLGVNSQAGASQIALGADGKIEFNTDATKNTGDSHTLTTRMTISAGGNIGIGTTTVGQFGGVDVGLTVDSGGAYSGIAVTDGATTGSLTQGYSTTYLYNQANGNMLFGTNNTERMRISSSGAVGIGNTGTPAAPLHVKVTEGSTGETDPIARFERFTTGDNAYLDITLDNSTNMVGFQSTGTSNGGFTFGGATTDYVTIASAGNVGIGGPGNAKLEVFGPLASPALGTYNNSAAIISTIAGGYGMSFSVDGTGAGYIQAQNFTSAAAYNLVLQSAGGNVGIGDPSPSNLLTLKSGSQYQGLTIKNGSGGFIGELVGFASGNDAGGLKLWEGGVVRVQLLSNGGSYLAGGNVSIGTGLTTKGRLTVEGVSPATGTNTLALLSASGSSKKSGISLYGTFVSPTADQGKRRVADITAGFSTANWGTEYLAFHVGTGASNDAQAVTTERARIDGAGRFLVGATDIAANVKAVIQASTGEEALRLTNADGGSGSVQGETYLGFHIWPSNSATGYVHSPVQIGIVETSVADYDAHLVFKTRNSDADVAPTERMRITDSGNVGINATGNTGKLIVKGGGAYSRGIYIKSDDSTNNWARLDLRNVNAGHDLILFQDQSGNAALRNDSSSGSKNLSLVAGNSVAGVLKFETKVGTTAMRIDASGYVTIAGLVTQTSSSSANVVCNNSTGTLFRSTSSRRYKENIVDAEFGLSELLVLRPVNYNSISDDDGNTLFSGLIAEEVHEAGLTTFVSYDDQDRPDALHYASMVSLCIKAIQEQQAMIETLQAQVTALE